MKKTFNLNKSDVAFARQVEAAKHEIRKYLKRERRKSLPKGIDFWDFDCRTGDSEEQAVVTHVSEVINFIDKTTGNNQDSFYIEILAKPGVRTKKPTPERTTHDFEG